MKTKIFALLFFVLFAWFIPGCYVGSLSQDNGSGYNSNSPEYNSNYPEYNVDDLNQYGQWEDVSPYGSVWSPSVVNNWQPFENGHWTYDGNDWVWVSYEPFGWIVYHYGSWDYSPDYGWFWIPGNDEWTPASVQWIDYGDYVGWAPRRSNNRIWSEPWNDNDVHPWTVVRMGDFNKENINSYRVPSVTRDNNVNQKPIQRRQPDVKTIQRYVKDPIGVVKFEREPVVTRIPPIRTNNAPERTITSPPARNDNPPERTVTPPPVRNDNPPPQRTYTPPVRNDNPTVRTNTPPVTKIQGNRNIVRMRVPPTEKQKVDKYSPKVQKEVLVKKKPQTQK
jgi:hypothetical protein